MNQSTTAGRHYPDKPFVGVGVVVWHGDRFLLIKRGKPPRQGQWSIPGGGQELGESLEEAAIREVREETGLRVEIVGLVDAVDSINRDPDGRVNFHMTLIDYCAVAETDAAIAGSDAADVGWFGLDDLAGLALWSETGRIIRESRSLLDGG